jgi:cysteinyl-tRNA synthetase
MHGVDGEQLCAFQKIIAMTFGCFASEEKEIPHEVLDLLKQRKAAREGKDFVESDRLRNAIASWGYEVRDKGAEQIVKKL